MKKLLYKIKSFWLWVWHQLKDWKTFILFIIVFLVLSSEIWVPYIIALIVGIGTATGKWLIGVASACWLFWLLPGTPFLPLCILITLSMKGLLNHVKSKKIKEFK